ASLTQRGCVGPVWSSTVGPSLSVIPIKELPRQVAAEKLDDERGRTGGQGARPPWPPVWPSSAGFVAADRSGPTNPLPPTLLPFFTASRSQATSARVSGG